MTSLYYNMAGEAIGRDEWAALWTGAPDNPMAGRRVAEDTVNDRDGHEHYVSTVLLGLDHNFGGGPPIIFETMVFCHHDGDCEWDEYQERYATRDEARAGHERIVGSILRA